jgi:hypothetical protein
MLTLLVAIKQLQTCSYQQVRDNPAGDWLTSACEVDSVLSMSST